MQQHTERQRRQISFTLFIAWSLFFIVIFPSCDALAPTRNEPPPEYVCSTPTSKPMAVKMAYDQEAQAWIEDVVKAFNKSRTTACDGPITVQATPMSSGQAMQDILAEELQPDIWIPGGKGWLQLLNAQLHSKNRSNLVSTSEDDTPSLISSPVVIAMWQSQIKALDLDSSGARIGWADITKVITDPQGWKTYGHPEWGKFKLGNTNAKYSNSGLSAIIDMNYAGTCYVASTPTNDTNPPPSCKDSDLTTGDVNSSNTKKLITTVESSFIYHGGSSSSLADKMFSQGPNYLSAIAVEEKFVIEANDKTKYPNLPSPVTAIYPKEGTVTSDYPFAILQGKWVSPSKKGAAIEFRKFLQTSDQQAKAIRYGFRPSDPSTTLAAPIDKNHGVDPAQPSSVLPLPNINVLQAIQANWEQQRRGLDVMLVADVSGRMNFTIDKTPKIDGAKRGLKAFVKSMSDRDQVGLVTFSNQADILSNVTPLGPKIQDVLSRIDGLFADGGALFFDTVGQQFKTLQQLPPKDTRAMIVLSNQRDNQSNMRLDQLVSLITPPSGQDPGQTIRIFTIAYGQDADKNALTQIATKTGGQNFSATPKNIEDVYQQIAALI